MASFSGHETFPLRYAWLAKAVEAVTADPEVFRDDRSIATFGVGRNMVRAIRHWGLATQILAVEERGAVATTPIGRALFGADGADPYCEDPATLWWLHWMLCREPDRATLYHFVFGWWQGGVLDQPRLRNALDPWLEERGESPPSDSTLRRDLQCLIGTYTVSARQDPEDALASPLSSLGLLAEHGGTVALRHGHHAGLPPRVFAAAVLDHWDRQRAAAETLAVADWLHAPGSPGRVFLLSEDQAFSLIAQVEDLDEPPFRYAATAGLQQLYRTGDATPAELLAHAAAVPVL